VTRVGTLRVRVARTRQRAFLPAGLARLERRAAEVLLLIREAFLRGLSTRVVGWGVPPCSRRRQSVPRRFPS
jgi:transposase-like protein